MNFLEEKLQPKKYPSIERKSKECNDTEYFIGLRNSSGKWTWISNGSIEVAPKKAPWASSNHPDDKGKAHGAKMYFVPKNKCSFVYDDMDCNKYKNQKVGYICEKRVDCHNKKGMRKIVHISIY